MIQIKRISWSRATDSRAAPEAGIFVFANSLDFSRRED
jgi:hypothetical protein